MGFRESIKPLLFPIVYLVWAPLYIMSQNGSIENHNGTEAEKNICCSVRCIYSSFRCQEKAQWILQVHLYLDVLKAVDDIICHMKEIQIQTVFVFISVKKAGRSVFPWGLYSKYFFPYIRGEGPFYISFQREMGRARRC